MSMSIMFRRRAGAVIVLFTVGCGSGDGGGERSGSVPTPTATATPVGTVSPTPNPAVRAFAVGTTNAERVPGIPETPVLRSDDGGRSWVFLPALDERARAIDFADRETGWLAGDRSVFRTIDGGVSWTGEFGRTSVYRDVFAFSDISASVVGRIVDFSQFAAEVVSKRDGSAWEDARWSPSAVRLRGDLHFVCYAASGLGIAVGTVDGRSALVLVRNRGESAEEISDRIALAPVVSGACAGEHDLWTVGDDTAILHSTDGGVTWESLAESVSPLFTGDLAASDFVDRTTGWIAGTRAGDPPRPAVLRTVDGGASWSVQTLPPMSAQIVVGGLDFVASGAGVLAIERLDEAGKRVPATLVTSDFGATWELGNLPPLRSIEDVTLVE
jgi:photosystem II stability/assembly factor-like uncharacterized protein